MSNLKEGMPVTVYLSWQDNSDLCLPARFSLEWIQDLFVHTLSLTPYQKKNPFCVSLCLADDPTMQHYNAAYRNKPNPTDVLSFPTACPQEPWPMDEQGAKVLGDILINMQDIDRFSPHVSEQEAHCAHLLIHGFLHLLHYDHETDAQAQEMQDFEIKALSFHNWSNPYSLIINEY